ncbi:hypothetical protein [Kitasatospora sp. NBC_01302]|uniref:hypothetical protein n=1 Tax=Kitasatospora sp. NBC_01302 TaxID=2903575 RepID=UPI002E0F60EF|nr:hypothetical protein OG294_27825 [Kitasatospora sp. NBC_01302]
MSTDTTSVAAQYLTVGGATVDLTVRISHDHIADEDGQNWADINHQAACTGCGAKEDFEDFGTEDTEPARSAATNLTSPNGHAAKRWAQDHAATCRALPRG